MQSIRHQGDGSPDPDKVEELQKERISLNQRNRQRKVLTLPIEIDIIQLSLFIIGLITRVWQLHFPHAAVFDELHYGRFALMYLKGVFFFDTQPPLAKMLLAIPAYLQNYTGNFTAEKIGAAYDPDFPVFGMRLVPAIFGSLLVPLSYQLLIDLKLSQYTAALGAVLLIADNTLLTQSRFMFIEAPLICFMLTSIISYLRFKQLTYRAFSVAWWFWMVMCGTSCGLCFSVKYIGGATVVLLLVLVIKDFWFLLPDWTYSDNNLVCQAVCRFLCIMALPVCIYVYIFYIHLSLLYKAGPHDGIMTSAFQASLQGGLASITKGQPLLITHGSQITLRHTHGQRCWLHSHKHVYPILYSSDRGSSHQQQVTCYVYKDVNNWWIVKDPNKNDLLVEEPLKPIKNGDIIQLVHGMTTRALNSHDVAAPMSPRSQEVSCYINYNVSMEPQNLWRVELVNADNLDSKWTSIQSYVRLIHVNTLHALKASGRQLGDWGFHQLEVVADRVINQEATIWNVEEHRYSTNDEEGAINELHTAPMIPTEPTKLDFYSKFTELQIRMLTLQHDTPSDHRYSSSPLEWPLSEVNVAYWADQQTGAQIHLLGNLVSWAAGTFGVLITGALLVFHILRRRRHFYDIHTDNWSQFVLACEVLLAGYIIHYAVFFLTDTSLFLHHYIPALLYKLLLLPALLEHLYILIRLWWVRHVMVTVVLVWLYSVLLTFYKYSVFSYGIAPLTMDNITDLKWMETWDFILPNS